MFLETGLWEEILVGSKYRYCGLARSRGWRTEGCEGVDKGKGAVAGAMASNVVSLQINTADNMAMRRMERIVLDPVRTYACTRTARIGVRVTVPFSL